MQPYGNAKAFLQIKFFQAKMLSSKKKKMLSSSPNKDAPFFLHGVESSPQRCL